MAHVVATGLAFPPHVYDQSELAAAARDVLGVGTVDTAVLTRLFRRVGVSQRRLAMPLEAYRRLDGLGARNAAFLEVGVELAQAAVEAALKRADLPPAAADLLATTTVTGIAVPSIDARLMNRLPLRDDLVRLPLFGLGCLGGAAGVARVADWLAARPEGVGVLVAVELCSLTFQAGDGSVANLVSTGLFGDGAAAVVLVGDAHPLAARGPRVVSSRSVFFPDTERVMGWDVVDTGFQVVLGPEVPEVARDRVPPRVAAFLASEGLSVGEVGAWVVHPGGPKVIDGLETGLGLAPGTLDPSRESLREVGNLSSASVLAILDAHLGPLRPPPGTPGVLMALGPAFSAELVLLRW